MEKLSHLAEVHIDIYEIKRTIDTHKESINKLKAGLQTALGLAASHKSGGSRSTYPVFIQNGQY